MAARTAAAHSGFARPFHDAQGWNPVALLEIKNLHVALEDGTEIVKGVILAVDLNEKHAIMGPNGSGKSTLAYALMGHPAYVITEGEILLDGDNVNELGADERAHRGLFLAFQYPHAIPGVTVTSFLRSALNATRKARAGHQDDPIPIPRVPDGAARGDGAAEGAARAGVALPQLRLLRRREEARRDPADGDAQAEDRGARRDRLRPRHRRAARSSRTASTSSSAPRDGRAGDHALPADPQLHHARLRARVRRRPDRRERRRRSWRSKLEAEGYEAFIARRRWR